jgi:hypothetical protein
LYPDATTIKTSCWNPGALQRGRGGQSPIAGAAAYSASVT